MKPIHSILLAGVIFVIVGAANAQPPSQRYGCIYSGDMWTWRAPDVRTIFIRTSTRHYFRLDLASACPELTWPGVHLITRFRGSDSVCTALDWDLKVSADIRGFPVSCIVRKMTPLSPDEAAAIPPRYRP